jgi:hypothetical protein
MVASPLAPTRRRPRPFAAALVAAALWSGGCDVDALVPRTADEAGRMSARVAVSLGAVGLEELVDDGVQAVELQVVDVELHRASDDAWLVLASEPTTLLAADAMDAVALTGLPLGTGEYDAVRVTLAAGRVAAGGFWSDARLDALEVVVPAPLVISGDSELLLDLDLERSLGIDPASGLWRIDAAFDVTVVDAPPPAEPDESAG